MNNENTEKKSIADMLKTFDPKTVELIKTDVDHDRDMIRLLLSMPPNKRTHFLRIPLPNGGSAI